MAKKPDTSILSRIDKRLKALAPEGKRKLSDRAAALKSGLSADGIRTLRRQIASGRQSGLRGETLLKLAAGLETTPSWLLEEKGPETLEAEHIDSSQILADGPTAESSAQRVRIQGYVGASGEGAYYKYADESFETVEGPAGSGRHTAAVEIRGKSWGPLMDSWLVFYEDVRSPITESLIGQVCIVGLADDRILLKKVTRDRDGAYRLIANSDEKPIENVTIEWAAVVTWMRPR